MKTTELPITLWNGNHLDGILTITSNQIPEQEDINTNAPREVQFLLLPFSADLSFIGSASINSNPDDLGIQELLNTITYGYVETVQEFKNREVEDGTARIH